MLSAWVGFRAHSGWAVAVAVAGGVPVYRSRIELCDRPGTAQPYHAAACMPLPKAEAYLEGCARISAGMAAAAVRAITGDLAARGYEVRACSILLGSGRPLGALEKTLASHPLIHTAEGEFYREALREGCRRCGVDVRGVSEREVRPLLPQAASADKPLGKPWRQDEKLCALAAGLMARRRRTGAVRGML